MGFAAQTNAIAPQLPSRHPRSVTSVPTQPSPVNSRVLFGTCEMRIDFGKNEYFQKATDLLEMTICLACREG